MLQPMVVVGDLKHIYFIVFSVTLLIYANPALSQLVGEYLIITTKKNKKKTMKFQFKLWNFNGFIKIMCECVCIYLCPKDEDGNELMGVTS